jgi:hypothetical protein
VPDAKLIVVRNRRANKEVNPMNAGLIIALVVAVPVILFPAAFVWYVNIGSILQAVRQGRTKKAIAPSAA